MKYHNIPTLFDNQASLINGKNIGTDSVRYIQDAGQKTAGTTYIDKNTNELYVCVTTTNSVNNDSNFSKFNLKEAFNKLDIIQETTGYYLTGGVTLGNGYLFPIPKGTTDIIMMEYYNAYDSPVYKNIQFFKYEKGKTMGKNEGRLTPWTKPSSTIQPYCVDSYYYTSNAGDNSYQLWFLVK